MRKKEIMRQNNAIQEEANYIARENNKILKEHYERESYEKDRANVSLKDYEKLKEDLAKVTSERDGLLETLRKIFKPFEEKSGLDSLILLGHSCNMEAVQKLLIEGKFKECKVSYFYRPDKNETDLAVIYTIDNLERI